MRRFKCYKTQRIYTEDELKKMYELLKKSGEINPDTYTSFEHYLNSCMVENNGSLEETAPEPLIEMKRRWTATKVAARTKYKYEEVLPVLQKLGVHDTWTLYEISNRPVDIEELSEIVEEIIGG